MGARKAYVFIEPVTFNLLTVVTRRYISGPFESHEAARKYFYSVAALKRKFTLL